MRTTKKHLAGAPSKPAHDHLAVTRVTHSFKVKILKYRIEKIWCTTGNEQNGDL